MLTAAVMATAWSATAEHLFVVEPSLTIAGVDDDNINSSEENPLHDQIRRLTPSLALRIESPRFSAQTSYGLDSETYAVNGHLDDSTARQRAGLTLQYEATERLTLTAGAGWLDTNTLTDLNSGSTLASSRRRAERLNFGPSLRFRMSPRLTATAAANSTRTTVTDGESVSSEVQTMSLERRMSRRDTVTVTYEHSRFQFDGEVSLRLQTAAVMARWARAIGPRSQVSVEAGPRFTDRAPALDFAASVGHEWRDLSFGTTLQRNQTVLVGYSGLVDTESLEARVAWAPHRRFTAFVSPAVIRTAHGELEGVVYRLTAGARYALMQALELDLAYHTGSQNGAIDPLRSDMKLSQAVFSIGLSFVPRPMQEAR